MMSQTRFIKLIVIILLLVCSAVVADCHCDCDDGECAMTCSHIVLIGTYLMNTDLIHFAYSPVHNSTIPHFAPDDVFQPPESAV